MQSVQFFNQVLGFEASTDRKDYARVKRDNVGISLIKAGDNINQLSCYNWVDNIDQLHEKLKSELEQLSQARYRALFDQAYGMREFHVI